MDFTLTLSCPDRPGIVAAVSGALAASSGNILEAQQFLDSSAGRFFMRIVFGDANATHTPDSWRDPLTRLAADYALNWQVRQRNERRKVLLLVSKFDHCLADLLYRWRTDELPMQPVGIVANHPRETYRHLDFGDIPFHYLPLEPGRKTEQEAKLLALYEQSGAELVVLARYMQILSDQLAQCWSGRCINIHHSFLPGFKGARPYHQAHQRGVKLIGATAHFVTTALDEGPIIEQDIERITHHDTPEDMIRIGRDIERRVLARALRLYLDDRVLIDGAKTIVFAS